jgi:hypothetical protein
LAKVKLRDAACQRVSDEAINKQRARDYEKGAAMRTQTILAAGILLALSGYSIADQFADDCAPRRREEEVKYVSTDSEQPCCPEDESRPLELRLQDRGSNHRKLLRPNGRGGERFGKRQGKTLSGLSKRTLLFPVDLSVKLNDVAPSLQPDYRIFLTTTRDSAPASRPAAGHVLLKVAAVQHRPLLFSVIIRTFMEHRRSFSVLLWRLFFLEQFPGADAAID